MKNSYLNRVVIASPSGNQTAVVFDDISGMDLAKLNTQISNAWQKMRPNSQAIEQCCYLTKPINSQYLTKVVLFGGEFSGNTALVAVKLLFSQAAPKGLIEVSGADKPLKYLVKNNFVSVGMPIPKNNCASKKSKNIVIVQLEGITHYVILQDENAQNIKPNEYLQKIRQLNYSKNELEPPAIGVLKFNQYTNKATFLIWVKSINTLFDETACGSGTCAIGVAMSYLKQANTNINVVQPSGETINVKTLFNKLTKTIKSSKISGKVDILYDGKLIL